MHRREDAARRLSWIPIVLTVVLSGLTAARALAWPGAHNTLTCTDCHAVEPDPASDAADTVTFVAGDLTET